MSKNDSIFPDHVNTTGLSAVDPGTESVTGQRYGVAAAGQNCSSACPLSLIPAGVWRDLLRPPFRKRYPWIFWGGILVLILLSGLPLLFFEEEDFVRGPRIALVSITGPIMETDQTLAWIKKIGRNKNVAGVLVRVDSPGGGAAASQELYEALRALALKKPLAVSMGSMAASGGLMVSMAGKRVFANASTVTGSIGVRMDIPQLQDLMGKLGVGQETLTTAPYKDAGSYLRPLTPEQRDYFRKVLEDMHQQFVDIVAKGRHMDRTWAEALANGKIYTGREALWEGLVDELGGQEDALVWLSEQCGVPAERKLLTRPRGNDGLSGALQTMLGVNLKALGTWAASTGGWNTPVFLYRF